MTNVVEIFLTIVVTIGAIGVCVIVWQNRRPDIAVVSQVLEEMRLMQEQDRIREEELRKLSKDYQELTSAFLFLVQFIESKDGFADDLPVWFTNFLTKIKRQTNAPMGRATSETPAPKLRRILAEYFSGQELQTMAYDLGIKDVAFSTQQGIRAGELIDEATRRSQLTELTAMATSMRPNAPWNS